jgi:LmbE family N-acetylglucosaminyl deacetylase
MGIQNTILVIAAHPDDESLGAGGAIYRATQAGDIVDVLFLSSGVGSRDSAQQESTERSKAAIRALNLLGCRKVDTGDFPDNSFDSVSVLSLAKFIESKISELRPNIIFTNFHSDLNIDHRRTAEASLIAARPKPGSPVNELYFYEVLSSTGWQFGASQFNPSYFVDITDSIEQKESALLEYGTEIELPPSARSLEAVKALARFRGNFIGFEYAEAFEIGFVRINKR